MGHNNKPWCQDGTDAETSVLTTAKSGMYHLLPMCHVYIKVRKKFFVSERLLPYFLHIPCTKYIYRLGIISSTPKNLTEKSAFTGNKILKYELM
jgi:hypothetical protein